MRLISWFAAFLVAVFIAALACPPQVGAADAKKDAAQRFGTEYIPQTTMAFASIRVRECLDSELVKNFRKSLEPVFLPKDKSLDEILDETFFIGKLSNVERAQLVLVDPQGEPVVIMTTVKPFDRKKFTAFLGRNDSFKEAHVKGYTCYERPSKDAYCVLDEKTLAYSERDKLHAYLNALADKKAGRSLVDCFEHLDAKSQLVAAVSSTRAPQPVGLPKELSPLRPLTKATWIGAEATVDQGVKVVLKVQPDKNADEIRKALEFGARQLLEVLDEPLKEKDFRTEAPQLAVIIEHLRDQLKKTKVETRGELLVASLQLKEDDKVVNAAFDEAVLKARDAAHRTMSQSNLRQFAIAMNIYESVNGQLPGPAIYDKDGKPLLSWRVAILPFIEEEELYKQFRMDEPWDSEHNKKLLDKMPRLYANPAADGKDKSKTYYKVFVGKSAAFEENTQLSFKQFSDGTTNTILVIEAGDPVPWTKPQDIPFDLKKPLPKLGGPYKRTINLVMADGHTVVIPKDIAEKKLRAAITRDQGDGPPLEDFNRPKGSRSDKNGPR